MAGSRAAPAAKLDADTARDLLATMWRIRCFEERVAALKRSLQVHGLIHLSIGGEGVAAAVCRQLREDDGVYSGHRAHGHAIAKGAPLHSVMAELMGRAGGLCSPWAPPAPKGHRTTATRRERTSVRGNPKR